MKNPWRIAEQKLNEVKISKDIEAVVMKISLAHPDYVGDSDEAKELIVALVDQAGYPVSFTEKIAGMLGLEGDEGE
jgi:hypothetical protein